MDSPSGSKRLRLPLLSAQPTCGMERGQEKNTLTDAIELACKGGQMQSRGRLAAVERLSQLNQSSKVDSVSET